MTAALAEWSIVEVRVGRPRVLATTSRAEVHSGIVKELVTVPELALGSINLDGDDQSDRISHGGPDKAVYAFPLDHYEPLAPCLGGPEQRVGENLLLSGETEHDVRIGDVVRWGDATLQVSQPRSPCFKLSLLTGSKAIGPEIIRSARTGWYLRVLEPGTVPTSGRLPVIERDASAPTVFETFRAMFPGEHADISDERAHEIAATPALADQWRDFLRARR